MYAISGRVALNNPDLELYVKFVSNTFKNITGTYRNIKDTHAKYLKDVFFLLSKMIHLPASKLMMCA